MTDLYYVRIRGSVVGPFRPEQVRQLVERGKIGRLHELSTDRQTWRPLRDFPELVVPAAAAAGGPSTPPADDAQPAPGDAQTPPVSRQDWYYDEGGQPAGPVDQAGIAALVASGRITPSTLVWTPGMKTWQPLQQTPLASLLPDLPVQNGSPSAATQGYPGPAPSKYCFQCGRILSSAAEICPGCGVRQPGSFHGSPPASAGARIPSYLAQAILCTLFCCIPFGIVAIVYAAQVGTKLAVGDYSGAKQASDSARTWCWVAFGTGLAVAVLYFGVMFLAALAKA